jgi:hypothetical protein
MTMGFTIISNDLAENPAIQSTWYDTDLAIIERGLAGVGVLTGCGVTAQGSPDMTVAVAAGTIQPSLGAAAVTVTSGNVTVGAASGSHPRIDLISASATGVKTITAGTAAASPKPPALPSGHIGLAFIYVPTSATTITTARITDKRCTVVVVSSAITNVTADCTADAGMSADTPTDATGASISLAAGDWLIFGDLEIAVGTGPTYVLMLITDASNAIVGGAKGGAPSSTTVHMSQHAKVSPGSTTTYKLRGQSGSGTIKKLSDTGAIATRITAIKLA